MQTSKKQILVCYKPVWWKSWNVLPTCVGAMRKGWLICRNVLANSDTLISNKKWKWESVSKGFAKLSQRIFSVFRGTDCFKWFAVLWSVHQYNTVVTNFYCNQCVLRQRCQLPKNPRAKTTVPFTLGSSLVRLRHRRHRLAWRVCVPGMA